MNDTEYEALKGRIEKLRDYWEPRLGLRWWTITFGYVRDASEFRVDDEPRPEAAGSCAADWRYLHAYIEFNMHKIFMQEMTDEELENVVVHELCHVLVNETRGPDLKAYMGHEERVTTTLAKAFIWTRDMTRAEVK